MVKLKRAYEPADRKDGYRVLVDRLWPRGIKKSKFVIDDWAKELAPSRELRKSFGHDPTKWDEFRAKYKKELRSRTSLEKITALAKRAQKVTVTLVYSARDEKHNNAIVLKEAIRRISKKAA